MASTVGTANTAQEPSPTASPRRGGGRGRGKGGARRTEEDGRAPAPANRGRGASRGRGRGPPDGGGNRASDRPSDRSLGKAPVREAGSIQTGAQSGSAPLGAEDDDENDVCFICASPVQHIALAPCNHRTCHICSLRLRALYKVRTCAHCRTESDHVIFADDVTKNYEDFNPKDFYKSLDSLGIHFENQETLVDTELLLRYNCPDIECDVACLGWPDLHRHVQTAHNKKMCDLCTKNKKVFTHEHELFTPTELTKHKKFGDDNPGAIDQSGFKGHPECGFCRQRFYGDDELFTHCRDKHERCHICDRRNEGRQQQYFTNYDSLEVHFKKDHFLCPDRECLEKKFVVFDSEIDIKAHQLEVHPNGLSKDALRDARRVDMSAFQFRAPHEPEVGARRGRGGREGGRGRGRDPNSESIPPSSAQPMSRAELAYQRQMAIQNSSQPTTGAPGRAFGGQLTSAPTPTEAFAARPASNAPAPSAVTASRPRTAATENTGTGNMPDAPRGPQEQARLLRHQGVIERASNMLGNDQSKLSEFRSQIGAYRTSKLSGTQLIDRFFSLFDTNPAELGKLVKELAEIFEVASKRDNLLKAWNDWRAINEDYPSLPGATAGLSLGGASTGHGGSRVLKLKSATAQSSRSAVSKQASWTTANNPFPPLSAASRIGAKPGQTPWASTPNAGSSARASSARASPMPSPMPSRTSSSVALNKAKDSGLADGFPSLPAAAKPTSTIFSPGYKGAGLRRDHSGRNTPMTNAWTAAGGEGSSSAVPADEDSAGAGGKKKGNKNKKQTLFHFG